MKVILCVDKKNGMMFFGKRQSRDRTQIEKMISLVGNNKLWVSEYSASLFGGVSNLTIDNDFEKNMDIDDYCFVEDIDVDFSKADTVIVYNWNRHYPADKYFLCDLKASGFKLIRKTEFEGFSHEKITEVIYEK